VDELAALLCTQGMDALPYHAGLPADERRPTRTASCARTAW
jgi:superfamily II helicase